MTPEALRSLLVKRNHSAASTADAIGCSSAQVRSWTAGTRPVPAWARDELAKLSDRAPDSTRWRPEQIGKVALPAGKPVLADARKLALSTAKPAKPAGRKRRHVRRPKVVDPIGFDLKRPIVEWLAAPGSSIAAATTVMTLVPVPISDHGRSGGLTGEQMVERYRRGDFDLSPSPAAGEPGETASLPVVYRPPVPTALPAVRSQMVDEAQFMRVLSHGLGVAPELTDPVLAREICGGTIVVEIDGLRTTIRCRHPLRRGWCPQHQHQMVPRLPQPTSVLAPPPAIPKEMRIVARPSAVRVRT